MRWNASSNRSDVRSVVVKIWAVIVLALTVGAGLSLTPGGGLWDAVHAIGAGLIVASVVGLFWQLRDVREFFLLLAEKTLVKDEYLKRLSLNALRQLRAAVASTILEARVSPDVRYDWRGLTQWVDDNLFERNLPSERAGSGIYRENYRVFVTLEFMPLEGAIAQVESPAADRAGLLIHSSSSKRP